VSYFSGWREEWLHLEGSGHSLGFYTLVVSSEHGELEWKRLGRVSVHRGWRCGLSPFVWSVASMVHCLDRKHARFSWFMCTVGIVLIVLVRRRAERAWQENLA
jgi:hypothetical protein